MLRYLLLSALILIGLAGCSNDRENPPKTLVLSLVTNEGVPKVTGYRVLNNPFKKSQQQGLFQAHLIDDEDKILRRINFEKIERPAAQNKNAASGFSVALPLEPNLSRVALYKLDGSSGHFQLKTEDPLLRWTLPEEVKGKITVTNNE